MAVVPDTTNVPQHDVTYKLGLHVTGPELESLPFRPPSLCRVRSRVLYFCMVCSEYLRIPEKGSIAEAYDLEYPLFGGPFVG